MEEKDSQNLTETISGTVEDVTCYKPDSGFCVFDIDYQGDLLTVVGTTGLVEAGEEVKLTGRFASHPTYGNQFRCDICERKLPSSVNAIKKYLAGGSFRGVGPALAKKIVDTFEEYTLDVIENTPLELTKVKGVSERMALEMQKAFKEAYGSREIMAKIQGLGLDAVFAVRAWKKWGGDAVSVIEENTYALCEADIGVPFEIADEIFTKTKNQSDEKRIKAGLKFVLLHNLENGHACLPAGSLMGATVNLLFKNEDEAEELGASQATKEALESLLDSEELFEYERAGGKKFIYLPELYFAEKNAAAHLKLMLGNVDMTSDAVLDREIDLLEEEGDIKYDSLQREAIKGAYRSHAFVLTGGPGTGKTTTLNALIKLLELGGETVLLAAPTGRAAKRLSEVTGREAKTIHRLLEVDFSNEGSMMPAFRKNERNPLKCDTLIVDEMSMVDSLLLCSLLAALPFSSRLVMVGDADQLPSVGPGNVLHDLLRSEYLPSLTLDRIFRQAAESMIVTNAHDIVNGEYPYLESKDNDFFFMPRQTEEEVVNTVKDLVIKRLPKAYGYDSTADIQVLCPGKKGLTGTWNLNTVLQEGLNPPAKNKKETRQAGNLFRENDKVMQTKNDYDITWRKDNGEIGKGIYNGDIGIVETIDPVTKMMNVRFDDRIANYPFESAVELDHAYAITVHKSQGSEFDAVVIPLFRATSRLYFRNLLYTAVTRAKTMLVIVGDSRAVMAMVDNNRKNGRFTNLRYMLEEKPDRQEN